MQYSDSVTGVGIAGNHMIFNIMQAMQKLLLFTLAVCCISCSESEVRKAEKTITAAVLSEYVSRLGSDEFMGRAPFTKGEEITVDYLSAQLKKIGFEPAFGDSYLQPVPMVSVRSEVKGPVSINKGGATILLSAPDDIAVTSPWMKDDIAVEKSEIVFAGFGIESPEWDWNDYEGLDVKGKTVLVLINDPGLYTGDSSLFRGREMTYYGRWTYKFEEAARQGAKGVLIIHDTEGAGYEYTIPRKSSITPRLYMQTADSNLSHCMFTGWLAAKTADSLLKSTGYDTGILRREACKKGFRGFPTGLSLSLSIRNTAEFNSSPNVAGILKGSGNTGECIVYTAHWDHFGIGESENGDSIYNGAVDNGTSMAWALEIGKAFSSLRKRPQRSVVILFPTAEEQGLLGSYYYTENPAVPMGKTVACFNNDLMLPIGRMKDLMITGFGQSDLDELLKEAAEIQDRYIAGDPDSHTGMYFRSDHFPFAKKGVPSAFARGNLENREKGRDWTKEAVLDYINKRYHRPADNYESEKWDLSGIAEDARIAFRAGYKLASGSLKPEWNENSEFRNIKR